MDDDFDRRLEKTPDVEQAISGLFNAARDQNEQRFALCILDLSRMSGPDRSWLTLDWTPRFIIQQFWDFLRNAAVWPSDFPDSDQQAFIRRLHMLAYSQFWECKFVQRLLLSLALTACGRDYDPMRLLGENASRSTNSVYEEIIGKTARLALNIAPVLKSIYNNQIRNAFSHSQVWEGAEYIQFENHDFGDQRSIPSLRFEVWDRLFAKTLLFMNVLLTKRSEADSALKSKAPIAISLSEFGTPFTLLPDTRVGWRFKQ